MSELKPIEEGCLAMIINTSRSENNGRIVTVLECIGPRTSIIDNITRIIWKVDYFGPSDISGRASNKIRENRLMRVDDPDLEEDSEEELALIEDNQNEH